MLRRLLAVAVLLLLVLPASAARRRVAAGRGEAPQDPAAWLGGHAYVLRSVDYPAPTFDLEPLRILVGDAAVVGLGDGTHGTREFFTVKLRAIDFLVREMNFDVIAFEAPLALFSTLDAYVQGGAGNPRAILADAHDRLGYRFWDVEEILAVIEWMRDYNAHRGARRAVHIAGADVFDGEGSAAFVVAYLRTVDPAAAAKAEATYGCIIFPSTECLANVTALRDELAARRAELEPRGAAAYEESLQNARVVIYSLNRNRHRDADMAENVLWTRQHRSLSRRIVMWAHGEHVGTSLSDFVDTDTMGMFLRRSLGSDYVAFGTMTASGTLMQWTLPKGSDPIRRVISSVPEPAGNSYETNFRQGPAPMLIVPLTGAIPAWLKGPAPYFTTGTVPINFVPTASLPEKFDAVIYIERTNASHPLRPEIP